MTAQPMVVRAGLPGSPAKQTQIQSCDRAGGIGEEGPRRLLLRFAALLTNLGCTPCIHALSFTTPQPLLSLTLSLSLVMLSDHQSPHDDGPVASSAESTARRQAPIESITVHPLCNT